uniref:Muscleblind-like protein n=2 Tax=Schistosoma mansoni TaxID=6183 RepID=A0A3Q0KBT3_SCHMA
MLHSPLSNPFPNNCSSTTTSECNECFKPDLTVLQSAIPFLTKPLLAIAGFPNTNDIPESTPKSFPIQPVPRVQAHQQNLTFGNVNSPSLSGSSSLSSSLVSLHSASNGCVTNQQISTSPVSVHSNHVSSGSRDSRWLKLRVCTSVLGTSNSPLQNNTIRSEKEPVNIGNKCSIKLEDTSTKNECSSTTSCQNENESNFHCCVLGSTCPYAHPPVTVRVENGYVTVCYDFIKRKLCKFSHCKYYHPPPHQIEAIIKRGDEQRKLLENQQRLSELRTSNLIPMQPLQQTLPTGLPILSSVASCPSSLRWPPTTLLQSTVGGSVYGTYLTPLNSAPDPTSLSASALLAAAAVLQQANQAAGVLPTSSTLSSSSMFPHDSVISKSTINNDTSSSVASEKWLPTKRANLSTSSSLDGTSQNKESTVACNGDEKLERSCQNGETKCHMPDSVTSFPTFLSCGSFNPGLTPINSCTDIGTSHVNPEVTNMLNPLSMSIYGLPFSSQPAPSLYTPSQFIYPPLYSMNNGCDAPNPMSSAAAALALNNFLIQQQQQLQSHQLLRTQLSTVSNQQLPGSGLYSSYVPSSTLTSATALAAAHQPPAHDVHTNASSNTFQHQQQALLLSLILRSQQAHLTAAQVAAVGYLSQNDTSRLPPIPALQNHGCVLDSSCPVPGALGHLSSGLYGTSFCSTNPMTNVAYINEKGHLLETLPICRDFKAGKCRRNSECRYVHLVDENVEVNQGRVTVCRDAAKGRCTRVPCKYYHIPLFAISANRSMALNSALASVTGFPTIATL